MLIITAVAVIAESRTNAATPMTMQRVVPIIKTPEPPQAVAITAQKPNIETVEATETPITTELPAKTQEEQQVRIYDLDLTPELQAYTFELCDKYSVDYELVLALMDRESRYDPNVVSGTADYGLMQINEINHDTLRAELGITDFLDPEQNIHCGVYMLSDLTAKYGEYHRILMAYNMGERGAREYVADGNDSSGYSRAIIARREELLEGGESK